MFSHDPIIFKLKKLNPALEIEFSYIRIVSVGQQFPVLYFTKIFSLFGTTMKDYVLTFIFWVIGYIFNGTFLVISNEWNHLLYREVQIILA